MGSRVKFMGSRASDAQLEAQARQEFYTLATGFQCDRQYTSQDCVGKIIVSSSTAPELLNNVISDLGTWESLFNATSIPYWEWERTIAFAIQAEKPNLLRYSLTRYARAMESLAAIVTDDVGRGGAVRDLWIRLWTIAIQDTNNLDIIRVLQQAYAQHQGQTPIAIRVRGYPRTDIFSLLFGEYRDEAVFDHLVREYIGQFDRASIEQFASAYSAQIQASPQLTMRLAVLLDTLDRAQQGNGNARNDRGAQQNNNGNIQQNFVWFPLSSIVGIGLGTGMVGVAHACGLELYISMPVLAGIGLGAALWRQMSRDKAFSEPMVGCATLESVLFVAPGALTLLRNPLAETAMGYQTAGVMVGAAIALTITHVLIAALEKNILQNAQASRV